LSYASTRGLGVVLGLRKANDGKKRDLDDWPVVGVDGLLNMLHDLFMLMTK
jgi:hypothetical protein